MVFYKEKLNLINPALNEEDIDMWIIAGHESATNTEPILPIISDHEFIGYTAVIFNRDGSKAVVCTPIDKNGYLHADCFDDVLAFPISFTETLAEYIKFKKPKKIALNFSEQNPASDGLSYGCYLYLKEAMEMAGFTGEVVSASPLVSVIKGIKSERELAAIKKACLVAEEIFVAAMSFIKDGISCEQLYDFFQAEVEKRDLEFSWPKSFNPGVFTGPNCPVGHMGACDVIIKKGHLVNVDFGVKVDGYSCDLQRMYYLLNDGETDAPEEAKAGFYATRDAIQLAAKALVPGVTGLMVDTVAREYLTNLGYADFNHALGHQLGREAHDGGIILGPKKPRYDRKELIETPIKEGFVFTLEPSVDTPYGNVGIEEDVVVTKAGASFIVPPQLELYLVSGDDEL